MSGRFIDHANLNLATEPNFTPAAAVTPDFEDDQGIANDTSAIDNVAEADVDNKDHTVEAVPSLESIREDLAGLVIETQTIEPQTEFIVDVNLDDDSKTLLDADIRAVIADQPETMVSLEAICLSDERSVNAILVLIDGVLTNQKT